MPAGLVDLASAAAPAPLADAVDLQRFLAHVPDPRDRRGRRYPLAAAAAAVLAGARSLTAISEWFADAPGWALRAVGFWPGGELGALSGYTGGVAVVHTGLAASRNQALRHDG
ncbi:transposase family protein [Streptomyces sp. NPDC050211]|jgi:hypothetical protein|uniref:transposase family protein n=1 Tax=Streptomyces sp. NPDC050211 TaxID=3154932 RepID=UPI003445BA3C